MSCHQLSLSFSSGQFPHCSIHAQIVFWCSSVEFDNYVLYCCCFSRRNDYSFPWNSLRSFAIPMHSHCIWKLEKDMQMIRTKTASLLVLGSTWLMRTSSTGKGSCSLWPQKLARVYSPEPYYELWAKQTGGGFWNMLCLYVVCILNSPTASILSSHLSTPVYSHSKIEAE